MSTISTLRTDLVRADLVQDPKRVKVISESQFNEIVSVAVQPEASPMPSKNIVEAMELVKDAIEHRIGQEGTTADADINILYEKPDKMASLEAVTIRLLDRKPGSWEKTSAQGAMSNRNTRALSPILREEVEDPDNPGYRFAVLGYFFDNKVRLTCWARTVKQANERAIWLEDLLDEYRWYFSLAGLNRVIYLGRGPDTVIDVEGNRIYGRPIDLFIRTERIRAIRQKTLEQILVYAAARLE
tara:strand:+ start:1359 stop:2084 length:726 start_codon:yes stop_codon:yes gene_type:complete